MATSNGVVTQAASNDGRMINARPSNGFAQGTELGKCGERYRV